MVVNDAEWMTARFATKEELAEFKDETLTRFDRVFGMLETLNQERIFQSQALLRIEDTLYCF